MEDYILKYDKDVAIKTGAMSYKLYIIIELSINNLN